jgi:hypothetical protein
MNPLVHRPITVAASAISCLGLVYSAYSQSSLGQARAAHDAAGQRNGMLPPLVDLGPGQTYNGQEGGLYPGGSNVRPAAHDAAGQKIARGIVPLAADGNPDPVNGKIVIMPVSVSNGYGAWHRGDESDTSTTLMTRANANPARNPKLFIAYGFEYQLPGGNGGTGDPGTNSNFYRSLDHALHQQGITPRQVQIVWLSMPVSGNPGERTCLRRPGLSRRMLSNRSSRGRRSSTPFTPVIRTPRSSTARRKGRCTCRHGTMQSLTAVPSNRGITTPLGASSG